MSSSAYVVVLVAVVAFLGSFGTLHQPVVLVEAATKVNEKQQEANRRAVQNFEVALDAEGGPHPGHLLIDIGVRTLNGNPQRNLVSLFTYAEKTTEPPSVGGEKWAATVGSTSGEGKDSRCQITHIVHNWTEWAKLNFRSLLLGIGFADGGIGQAVDLDLDLFLNLTSKYGSRIGLWPAGSKHIEPNYSGSSAKVYLVILNIHYIIEHYRVEMKLASAGSSKSIPVLHISIDKLEFLY